MSISVAARQLPCPLDSASIWIAFRRRGGKHHAFTLPAEVDGNAPGPPWRNVASQVGCGCMRSIAPERGEPDDSPSPPTALLAGTLLIGNGAMRRETDGAQRQQEKPLSALFLRGISCLARVGSLTPTPMALTPASASTSGASSPVRLSRRHGSTRQRAVWRAGTLAAASQIERSCSLSLTSRKGKTSPSQWMVTCARWSATSTSLTSSSSPSRCHRTSRTARRNCLAGAIGIRPGDVAPQERSESSGCMPRLDGDRPAACPMTCAMIAP